MFAEPRDPRTLAFLGLTEEDYAAEDLVEIWPENDGAVQAFAVLARQWRIGPGGPFGLDYSAVPFVLEMAGVPRDEWKTFFSDIRVMEDEALKVLHWRDQSAR